MKKLLALVAAAAVATAVSLGVARPAAKATSHTTVLTVAHGPVTSANSSYFDVPPTGPSVADTRTYYEVLTRPGSSTAIGYLSGVTTTVAVGKPAAGQELRTADLVFVIGGADNQIVVGGISPYAQRAQTLTKAQTVVRPIIGGSGRYAGARGWAVSRHLVNDHWTHTFHLMLP
jgi:hypothetical protein